MSDKSLAEKAVDIKGKQYVLVSDRVLYFNEKYPKGAIETELVSKPDEKHIIVKATIWPEGQDNLRHFTGYSQAVIGEGYINKTAALENAETSAVGRALAFMGIGVIDSVASVDEIHKATPKPAPKKEDDHILAAKDRTVNLLSMLGYKDAPKTPASRKTYYKDAVFNLVSLDLNDNTIEQVNEELAALVEKKDAEK